jgi:hypothetical protein
MAFHGDRSDPVAVFSIELWCLFGRFRKGQDSGLCGLPGQSRSVPGNLIQGGGLQIVCRLTLIAPVHR